MPANVDASSEVALWPEYHRSSSPSVQSGRAGDAVELSIVCPAFNEQAGLPALAHRVLQVMESSDVRCFELIVVDDGSSDDSWHVISQLAQQDQHIRGIRLARNFGHQRALLAGLAHSRGRAVVSMDADLQHPPECIHEMVRAWRNGSLVVLTKRRDAVVTSAFKRWTSRVFYSAFSVLTGVPMYAGMSDFRLLDASVVARVLSFRNPDQFLRGTVQWLGFNSTTIEFDVARRFSGTTKYTLRRMTRMAAGSIVSFSSAPLKLGILMAMVTGVLAVGEVVYAIFEFIAGRTVPGWASLAALVALLFAVQFAVLGILGIYIGRAYQMLQNRPAFVVQAETP